MKTRSLTSAEISLARTVFGNTLPYDQIYFSDIDLGGAVTAGDKFVGVQNGRLYTKNLYCIFWPEAFKNPLASNNVKSVFIHELTHVWQGQNGIYPAVYMGQSLIAQLTFGIGDIVNKREWKGWGTHRSTAYNFNPSDIGNNWSTFNVEQQASLIQSWYTSDSVWFGLYQNAVQGGNSSRYDARYPYIRDVILGMSNGAAYRPVVLPPGGDAEIKKLQDRLVWLGYLDATQADGLVGRSKSATLDAVAEFQRNNRLTVDRDLGGPNSETRRKLLGNTSQLVRKSKR